MLGLLSKLVPVGRPYFQHIVENIRVYVTAPSFPLLMTMINRLQAPPYGEQGVRSIQTNRFGRGGARRRKVDGTALLSSKFLYRIQVFVGNHTLIFFWQ